MHQSFNHFGDCRLEKLSLNIDLEVFKTRKNRNLMLIKVSLGRKVTVGAPHLNGLQPGHHLLPILVLLPQVSLQMLHHLLQILKPFLHTGPLGLGHLVQQSFGLALQLVLLQNAGENMSIDLQNVAHQLHVIVPLEEMNEQKRRFIEA